MTETDRMTPRLAGRELDAEIAEAVMGWRHWEMKSGHVYFLPPSALDTDYLKSLFRQEVPSGGNKEDAPQFSSDIAAAWAVVTKMRELGWYLIMNDTMSRYRARFFQADPVFWPEQWAKNPDIPLTVWAETAPLAICLAALAAVERRPE